MWSEVELGYRLLAPTGTRFVGVTGTNGKTTTTELLGAIFRAAGRDVAVAGNVGHAAHVGRARGLGRVRAVVVPARGRARRSPATSRCCSTSSPTTSTGTATLRGLPRREAADLRARAREGRAARPRPATGSSSPPTTTLPAEPLIRGAHNRENAAAATAAARAAGIGDDAIAEALRTFPGVPHRLELVGERDGVRYVNDWKATNVAAALRALAAYADEPVHVILGGSPKGEDFAPLAAAIGTERAVGAPDRRGGGSDRRGDRRANATARSTRPLRTPSALAGPATSSCSAPRARATTSSRTSSSAARRSGT